MNPVELSPEHLKLFKKFKRCVDSYSIEKMDKKLYEFFHLRCGFIAHYNIHGFRHEYSGFEFLRWFKQFSEPNWMFFLPHDCEYKNLKKACVNYAKKKADDVFNHFARLERNKKMQLLLALSEDLGVTVSENNRKNRESSEHFYYQEEENGQLSLFV